MTVLAERAASLYATLACRILWPGRTPTGWPTDRSARGGWERPRSGCSALGGPPVCLSPRGGGAQVPGPCGGGLRPHGDLDRELWPAGVVRPLPGAGAVCAYLREARTPGGPPERPICRKTVKTLFLGLLLTEARYVRRPGLGEAACR
ncbi:hypothetical protein NDU88_001337 [Pleurodeles waltl]|uniref:Uncharacterized protein n=1 Tax=Pleurodeles waltl TaxID=8319 RepID=A0AAV7TIA0_PLEWA|nr:hypothetical protein NDU88_001337 [Pleurodeles waltl]